MTGVCGLISTLGAGIVSLSWATLYPELLQVAATLPIASSYLPAAHTMFCEDKKGFIQWCIPGAELVGQSRIKAKDSVLMSKWQVRKVCINNIFLKVYQFASKGEDVEIGFPSFPLSLNVHNLRFLKA